MLSLPSASSHATPCYAYIVGNVDATRAGIRSQAVCRDFHNLCRGNSPDETVLSIPGNGDLEMSRYRQFSNALRYNKLRAHLTTVVHPDGLLDGVSAVGLSKGNWPIPSW